MSAPKKKHRRLFILLLLSVILAGMAYLFLYSADAGISLTQTKPTADTTAPKISCNIKSKTIVPGDTITVDSLGIRTRDSSEIKYIAFTKIQSDYFYTGLSDDEKLTDMYNSYREGIQFHSTELQFSYGGIYTLTIEACDAYEKKSEITLTIKVEEPPVIETPADFYVAVGSEIKYADYIDAWDLLDEGFGRENVKIDSSSVSLATAGTYPVSFHATDDYGLSSTAVASVHVLPKDELQNLINTHEININDHIIIGSYNPYDMGIFENSTMEETQNALLPSIVRVSNLNDETFGNGFILKIDSDMITICTCTHVSEDSGTPKITFYDGTTCFGAVVAQNETSDVAFIRIPIDGKSQKASLPSEYVKNLRSIHIDEGYWKALSDNADLELGYICITKKGDIRCRDKGTLLQKDIKKDWNNYENVHQMRLSMDAEPGSSGSALFDTSGRLLGMIRGHSKSKDGSVEKVGVPLGEILRLYERTFKEKVQYK